MLSKLAVAVTALCVAAATEAAAPSASRSSGGHSVATGGARTAGAHNTAVVRPKASFVGKSAPRSPQKPVTDSGYARVPPCPDFQSSAAGHSSLCLRTTETAAPKN